MQLQDVSPPAMIQKVWVKNKEKKGGTMQWLPHFDKLLLEWLANRMPPSCIQANLLAVAHHLLNGSNDIVKEIPSSL